MTTKVRLRWFQFTLRTAFIAMVMATIPLARIAYLRSQAQYHEAQVERIAQELTAIENNYQKTSAQEIRRKIASFAGSSSPMRITQPSRLEKMLVVGSEAAILDLEERPSSLWHGAIRHTHLAETYRLAAWRPWVRVKLPPPVEIERETRER